MRGHRRQRARALIGLLLAITALTPVTVREWPFILQGAPIWLMMLLQTLAVIAAGILVAGAVALLVTWRRESR